MNKKFIAKIFQRYENGSWHETLSKTIDVTKKDFNIGARSFVTDLSKVSYYSKNGLPVLSFYLDNAIPLTEKIPNSNSSFTENTTQDGKKPSSSVFDFLFRRKMIESLLSASTKQTPQTQWYIYLALGVMIGIIGGLVGAPYIRL